MAVNLDEFMTTADVASMIRRPTETLRYWRWKGIGPRSFKIGRSVVYERRDVLAWIDSQKAATASGDEVAA